MGAFILIAIGGKQKIRKRAKLKMNKHTFYEGNSDRCEFIWW